MRLGSRIALRALVMALTIGGCLAARNREGPASDPQAALESLSVRRVAYVRHLAAVGSGGGRLGQLGGSGSASSWLLPSARRLLAGSGRARRELPEQEPPGSVQLLSMLLNDRDASLSDPEGYWPLPPAPPGGDRAPASGVDPAQQGDTAAQVRLRCTVGSVLHPPRIDDETSREDIRGMSG